MRLQLSESESLVTGKISKHRQQNDCDTPKGRKDGKIGQSAPIMQNAIRTCNQTHLILIDDKHNSDIREIIILVQLLFNATHMHY